MLQQCQRETAGNCMDETINLPLLTSPACFPVGEPSLSRQQCCCFCWYILPTYLQPPILRTGSSRKDHVFWSLSCCGKEALRPLPQERSIVVVVIVVGQRQVRMRRSNFFTFHVRTWIWSHAFGRWGKNMTPALGPDENPRKNVENQFLQFGLWRWKGLNAVQW